MKVIRASKAGFPCNRHLWYMLNNYKAAETDTQTQMIFDTGTQLEPLIVDFLRRFGWTVLYNPGSQEAGIELTYPIKGGMFAGHFDCFISKGEMQNVLADIKTMKERAYMFWRREGSLKSKSQYVDQLHIYAGAALKAGYAVEHLAIVGFNKNNSNMHVDIFDYDPERFKTICDRSEEIIAAKEAPCDNCPREAWCCGYCEYSDLCELSPSNLHKANTSENVAVTTQDEEIIGAMEQLQEARIMSLTGSNLEHEAKAILDKKVRQQGITSIQGGGFVLHINERGSSRFDSAAFKKAHPELVSQFMKESKSTFFNVERLEPLRDD